MNRRSFVSTLAAAGAAASSHRLFAAAPGDKPTVGVIGCGWLGVVNMENLQIVGGAEVVSLCDPNAVHLKRALETAAKHQSRVPRTFADFRAMLAEPPEIVVVGTPDHWHALPAIAAMQAGADVHLEKPIGVDVLEGEALVAAARKYQRVVQVNTQRRSLPMCAEVKARYLASGRLGKIGRVETFCHLGMGRSGRLEAAPAPADFDYELWTGPAPMLPFKPGMERGRWRRYQAFGNGILGDMGVHMFDLARHLLDLGWPTTISSDGGIFVETESDATITDTQHCVFQYPDFSVTWEHRTWGVPAVAGRHWTDQWGVRILGSKGTLTVTSLRYEFTPVEGGEVEAMHLCSPDGDPAHADLSKFQALFQENLQEHARDFLAARAARGRPCADIADAHISSSSCVLANLALELGRPLAYDPTTRTVRGDPEATARLARAYRGPWEHPHPDRV
jgi:predicted dehydrogenase